MQSNDTSLSEVALRRIRPVHVVRDPKAPEGRRASSAAFEDDRDGSSMSVYLRSIVYNLGLAEENVVEAKATGWAVSAIPVHVLAAEEQTLEPNPVTDAEEPHPCDPAHALVHGDKRSKARRDRIAKLSPLIHVVP
jgi:hypothetical protein